MSSTELKGNYKSIEPVLKAEIVFVTNIWMRWEHFPELFDFNHVANIYNWQESVLVTETPRIGFAFKVVMAGAVCKDVNIFICVLFKIQ